MQAKGVKRRLDFLTREFSVPEWRLLGAIALEWELALSAIQRLMQHFGLSSQSVRAAAPLETKSSFRPSATELALWLEAGLVIEVGEAQAPSLRAGGQRAVYAVAGEFRQLVLRHVGALGELVVIAEATQKVLADRSFGVPGLLLASGRLSDFDRASYLLAMIGNRLGRELHADALLLDAIARPFDAEWFEAVWQRDALPAARRALAFAAKDLSECDGLFNWALAHSADDSALGLVLAEHAILRGNTEVAEQLASRLPAASRRWVQAAIHYQNGDLTAARRSATDERPTEAPANNPSEDPARARVLRAKKPAAPSSRAEGGGLAPLLALLAYSAESDENSADSKRRWLRGGDASIGVERAFRTLLRYGAEATSTHARLDVHQLAHGATSWELIVLGLTVHLHQQDPVTRASWTVALVQSGATWIEASYTWLGRQALLLARALDLDYFNREFERVKPRLFIDSLAVRPLELSLADLITPKPEWQRTLDALERVAAEARVETESTRRVTWYLNMVEGALERPALQQWTQTGWTRGRRLSVSELWEIRHELPPEDLRVLERSERVGERHEFTPEALEVLIGHPRVVNGARGAAPVEVVRGTCRVETVDDRGYLVLRVEPRGARLGINTVVENDARIAVYRVTPAMQRVIEVLPEGLRVPKDDAPRALRVLGNLARGVEVHSRHLGADRNVEADARPCLRITPKAGAWLVQAGVRPFGDQGRFFLGGSGSRSLSLYTGGERLLCLRDFPRERAGISRLILECPTLLDRTLDAETRAPGEAIESWDFDLNGLLELLLELSLGSERPELEWPESPALTLRGNVTAKGLVGGLRSKKGWYLMSGSVVLDDGDAIDFNELLLANSVEKGRFVRLPSGDYVALEAHVWKVMHALEQTRPLGAQSRELRLPKSAIQALAALAEFGREHSAFSVDAEATEWLERVAATKEAAFEVPSTLEGVLRSYQEEGFRWLCRLSELGLGACLADDMGLGKTIQILALLARRAHTGPTLVVAPTSVCLNWMREAARFAPTLRTAEYAGSERAQILAGLTQSETAVDLLVCSYGLLQQDIEALCLIEWGSVVLDEAQFIKNPRSQRALAAYRLQAQCRIAATGTPVENHLGDLWSIFNFLNPGLLGTWRSFSHRFVKPIEQRQEADARGALRELIKPFILRRTKAEVLADLPPLTVVHHTVNLSESEAQGYALLRRQIREKLLTASGRRDNKIEVLAEITRLRRYCCHPRLVFPGAESEASKIEAMLALVLEMRENQHRALIFSQYVDFLELVRERLDEAQVTYQYLDGSTPRAERQARVDAFQAGEGSVFLISLKAGGFGLNLTAADYVIHLDPWWNPAVEAQATDRAHRIGQDRPVTVYRLITKDTIEDDIVELHQSKRALASAVLEDGDAAAALSTGELIGLIERGL